MIQQVPEEKTPIGKAGEGETNMPNHHNPLPNSSEDSVAYRGNN